MALPTSHHPAAGVVGAGIAGLSAAIALRRAGWDVEVFEKSRMEHEVGAAITIMPGGNAILDSWGFDFTKARGVPCQHMTILHAGTLSTLNQCMFPDVKSRYNHDAMFYHRVDLHQGLLELALEPDTGSGKKGTPIIVRAGTEVESVNCREGTLMLASGEQIQKDLLVVADGAYTRLFSDVAGQPDPTTRIGRSLYRILLDRSNVNVDPAAVRFLKTHPSHLSGFCCALDPVDNAFFITYPCRGGTMLNVAVVHNTKKSPKNDPEADASWQTPSDISEVLETAHNFHPDLKSMLHLAAVTDIKIHHGMNRPPLKSFINGRVVLVGDAAHLMLPTHAAGASMAIESAGVLEILMREVATSHGSFPPTPAPMAQDTSAQCTQSPDSALSPTRPTCSTSSSTRDLIVGVGSELNAKPSSSLKLAPPVITVTSTDAAASTSKFDLQATITSPPQTSSIPTLTSSLISRSLTLFDSLRVPRCTAIQILSNGGFMSQARPEVVEQIRRHGFDGPLPGPTAGPWGDEFRKWYFDYDARAAAEKALRELSPK